MNPDLRLRVRDLRELAFALLVTPILLIVGVLAVPAPPQPSHHCADIIAHQLSSDQGIKGSRACLGGRLLLLAISTEAKTDQDLADALPALSVGTWEYVGQSKNGDYIYSVTVDAGTTVYAVRQDNHGLVVEIYK